MFHRKLVWVAFGGMGLFTNVAHATSAPQRLSAHVLKELDDAVTKH